MLCVQGTPWKQPNTYLTLFICILNQLGWVLLQHTALQTATSKTSATLWRDSTSLLPATAHALWASAVPSAVGRDTLPLHTAYLQPLLHCGLCLHLQPQIPSFNHCRFFASTCHPPAPQITDSDLSVTAGLRLLGLLLHIHKCAYIYYPSTFIIT